jgi:molybdopterin synthase catalytic subunit
VSASPSIRVRVRCFSHVRAVLGRAEIDLDLPANSTAGDAAARVSEMGEGKLAGLPMKIALNHGFVEPDAPLADGDEIALIPPVQGGSATRGTA